MGTSEGVKCGGGRGVGGTDRTYVGGVIIKEQAKCAFCVWGCVGKEIALKFPFDSERCNKNPFNVKWPHIYLYIFLSLPCHILQHSNEGQE